MDGQRFDRWARALAARRSRRHAIAGGAAIVHGLAAGSTDLGNHAFRQRNILAAAVLFDAQVVDQDAGALAGGQQGDFPPDTATGARYRHHLAVEHGNTSLARYSLV